MALEQCFPTSIHFNTAHGFSEVPYLIRLLRPSALISSLMIKLSTRSPSMVLTGPGGTLSVPENDEITRKLAMLYEGECEDAGPLAAAKKFGFSKQRYFQLRILFEKHGALGLQSHKRGPKTTYRRTDLLRQLVIRHRFLDPDASPEVLTQMLKQAGHPISVRSVNRVIAEVGLQKKTLRSAPQTRPRRARANPTQRPAAAASARRPRKSSTRRPAAPG